MKSKILKIFCALAVMSASFSGFAADFVATEDGHWDQPHVWGQDRLIPGRNDNVRFAAGTVVSLDHSVQITAIRSNNNVVVAAPFTITGADTLFRATGVSQFWGGTRINMYVTDATVQFNELALGNGGHNNFYFDNANLIVANWSEHRGSTVEDGSMVSFLNDSTIASNQIALNASERGTKGSVIVSDSTVSLAARSGNTSDGNLSATASAVDSRANFSVKNASVSAASMLIVRASNTGAAAYGILDNVQATFNAANTVRNETTNIRYGGASVEASLGGTASLTIANGTVLNTKGVLLYHQADSHNLLEIYGPTSAIVSTINTVANANSDTLVANNHDPKAENSSAIFSFGGYDASNKFQPVKARAFSNEADFWVNEGGTLRYILGPSNLALAPQDVPIVDAHAFRPMLGNLVIDLSNVRKLPAGDHYAFLLSSTESIANGEEFTFISGTEQNEEGEEVPVYTTYTHDWNAAFERSEIIDSQSDPAINATFLGYEISEDGKGLYVKIHVITDDVMIDMVRQPAGGVFYSNQTASLSVEVDAYAPQYQWKRSSDKLNWTPVDGANEASYVLENPTPADSDWYMCVISNDYDTVESDPAQLTVYEHAKIHSVTPAEYLPATTSIFIDASGYDLKYQWEESVRGSNSWTAIEGATDATLLLPPNSYADRKVFRCKLGNTSDMLNGLISDSVDSQCTITINSAFPEIVEAYSGQAFELAVEAESLTPLVYTWYTRKTADAEWVKVGSKKKNISSFTLSASANGTQYKCAVNDARDTLEFVATIDVQAKATIKKAPKATTGFNDKSVTLSITATGRDLRYQWQVQVPDPANPKKKIWVNVVDGEGIAGAQGPELTLKDENYDLNGAQYRCIVSNTDAMLYPKISGAAKITIKECVKVLADPVNSPVKFTGESASFSCSGGGYSPKYQWEVQYAGTSTWEDIKNATSKKLTVSKLLKTQDQAQYRCRIYNTGSQTHTMPATLTVHQKTELTVPYVKAAIWYGQTGSIVVNVKAEGGFDYKWYVKVKGAKTYDLYTGTGGSGSSDSININLALPMTANDAYNGAKFKLEAKGKTLGTTVTSKEITLVFADKTTLTESASHLPEAFDATTFAGLAAASYNATFAVKAKGLAPFKYQWQESSNGMTWANIQGATSATYTIKKVANNRFGARFRCQVTNAAGVVTSSTYTLLRLGTPTLTRQPAATTTKTVGDAVEFSVAASAASGKKATYQWFIKKPADADFLPIAGATKAAYAIKKVTLVMNGNQYRCVVSNAVSKVNAAAIATSNIATLRVNAAQGMPLRALGSAGLAGGILDELDGFEREAGLSLQSSSASAKESARITKGFAKMLANGLVVMVDSNELAVDKHTPVTLVSGLGGEGAEFFWSVSCDEGATWLPLPENTANYSFIAEESAYFKCTAILGKQSESVLFELSVR